jgi:large subunit ribosomal protein L5|tara:strand:+ start:5157 stop:5699 length:543 start_codon:yes stop_codon:yes gene_type:complete
MTQRLKTLYKDEIQGSLKNDFQFENVHEVPKLVKIQINRGLGVLAQNNNILKRSIEEMRLISGQQPVVTNARKSIAGFKIREEQALGVTVTLRGDKMYAFLERFINLVLPRIRDFQGLNPNSFDRHGNYNMGLREQLIFPEIDYNSVEQLRGFNITIVTTAKTKQEGFALLKAFGFPFRD